MSVENTTVIDFVSLDKEGNVVLTVSDDLEWDKENTHLLKLHNKINAYLDAINNGSLFDNFPEAKDRKIIISVMSKYFPNPDGEEFLASTQETLQSIGYEFGFNNLIK